MTEKNIIIIRHFETFKDDTKCEKIDYNKSLKKSVKYVKYIQNYIDENSNIKKIKFFTSKHDRTIMTSLILCSGIKTKIISNELNSIEIYDPVISDMIDRDPTKTNYKKVCKKINNSVNEKLSDDTLYIFVTHSSLIYNLFNCLCKLYSDKYKEKPKSHIHTYSLSLIKKTKKTLTCDFNINMK